MKWYHILIAGIAAAIFVEINKPNPPWFAIMMYQILIWINTRKKEK